jgi:hypothetical protein
MRLRPFIGHDLEYMANYFWTKFLIHDADGVGAGRIVVEEEGGGSGIFLF